MVKLGDFGIARILASSNDLAQSVIGTPYSMSPEVCENKPYGFPSDIWALGCLLYELCALKHAFDARNLLSLVWKIVKLPCEPVPSIYSDELRKLVHDMLHKDPHSRPTIHQILQRPIVLRRLVCISKVSAHIRTHASHSPLSRAARFSCGEDQRCV